MAEQPEEQKGTNEQEEVVIDKARGQLSDLWKKEDYWAIWLGFAMLIFGMLIYFNNPPAKMNEIIDNANKIMAAESEKATFKTIEWYKASDKKKKLKATGSPIGKKIKTFTNKPHSWKTNPLEAFFMGSDAAEAKKKKGEKKYDAARLQEESTLAAATSAQAAATAASYANPDLNKKAKESIETWRNSHSKASKVKKKTKVKPYNQIFPLIGMMIVLGIFFGIGMHVMGNNIVQFLIGFTFVFFIAVLAYLGSSQATMKSIGIGYPAWGILFGMIISNTIGTPKWVKPAVQTEYYIKTGLVLLGAEILFSKILLIGIPGIFVAWVVTPIVLVTTYIFGQKIVKIPSKTLNMTISADMSVCGVSAAIATAAACRAKKEELTLAVGLSLVFTSVMMIIMPMFIKAVGMPHILGGAWMGGTIDATGAVAAAGAFLSDKALYVAATIKMIQNVLIGVIAFCVAFYWCARVECAPGQKIHAVEIWHRFPKFVLGFIAASIIFSLIYQGMGSDAAYALVDHGAIRGMSKIFRGWFFCLAFVSIGLATNFKELADYFAGGKPLILYACGQSFNLAFTLLMAYIMFYKVFYHITEKI
ncbi:putative sulfate exporter family transporter [Desulfobacterales bacterium HSG16]|nr:putative sulfate exporter family transporter [Desulfobacterales bacterium HSG16]